MINLISVVEEHSVPMVVQAIRSMPKARKWVFIILKELVEKQGLEEVIKNEVSNPVILPVDRVKGGPVCSLLLGKDEINTSDSLFIGNCDNALKYDWDSFIPSGDVEAVAFTFTRDERLRKQPNSFSWVIPGFGNRVKGVSVNAPISQNPFNDHALTGSFWFKTGIQFVQWADELIEANDRVNNAFYIDKIIDRLAKANRNVFYLPVKEVL